jgi:hypothetical protein
LAKQAKDLLIKRFAQSEETRWITTLKANVLHSLIKTPALAVSYLPTIPLLLGRVNRSLALVKSDHDLPSVPEVCEALDVLGSMMEVSSQRIIRVFCLSL